ncbi:MAG: LacI family DNA-binding transcriptional regulator [Kiritimatiellae bacterium]|nr:LacI family DNA-binding transcriptional regulator [Kiritimatiellia bacterium]
MSTKTEQVRRAVFNAVLRGDYRPGDRIPAERDMAALTGTSRITVRRAYADLARTGILERTQGRGTLIRTAPAGRLDPAGQVALLAALRDPFALEFIAALETALARRDGLLVVKVTDEDPRKEEAAAVALVRLGLRRLVVWPAGRHMAAQTLMRLRILGAGIVFFDRILPGPLADFVGLDNAHAVTALLAHAVANGRRRFVFVGHSGLDVDSDRQREQTFLDVCGRRDLPHACVRVPWRGDVRGVLRKHRAAWRRRGTGLALVCVNDAVALAVRETAGPGPAVYGIDGLPEARRAGIVSYRQPMARMARKAIELLAGQARDAWHPRQILCRGRILI